MEFKYGDWILIREMSGFMTADLSDIYLSKDSGSGGGYFYEFEKDGRAYDVNFRGPLAWTEYVDGGKITLANSNYSVSFTSGGSSKPVGNTKVPTAIYTEVFMAIRKLLETVNPEALTFYGAHYEQDAMYDIFYRKYLSKGYTRVGADLYLRNDLYNKYKQENGQHWEAIKTLEKMEGKIRRDRIEKGNANRTKARQYRLGVPQTTSWHGISGNQHQSPLQQQGLRRGDRTAQGGIYVGTTPTGTDWVAYDDSQFASMSQHFDSQYAHA